MKEIRDFNKAAGTYSNTTIPSGFGNSGVNEALQCATYTDPDTGIEYSVKCLSTFLNDDSNRFFTSLKPREETSQFTLWTESEYCVTNGNCVLSREDGIGPSWK